MTGFFDGLKDYDSYIDAHQLGDFVNPGGGQHPVAQEEPSADFKGGNYSPREMGEKPYPPQRDDLVRLHYLILSRKVTTILEFGSGHSTRIFDHGLEVNRRAFGQEFSEKFRGSNLFECHTVEDDTHWINHTQTAYQLQNVHFTLASTNISTFSDRICTFYDQIPNICPDLIYLDGPDQFSAGGEVRGVSTAHPDRLPMAADILPVEHFLLPGTLIVIDGRAANARFLQANLQRNWSCNYHETYDQHFFELVESPLGGFNRSKLQFQLGADFFKRVEESVRGKINQA